MLQTLAVGCLLIMFGACHKDSVDPPVVDPISDLIEAQDDLSNATGDLIAKPDSPNAAAARIDQAMQTIFGATADPFKAVAVVDTVLASRVATSTGIHALDEASRNLAGYVCNPSPGARRGRSNATPCERTVIIFVNGVSVPFPGFLAAVYALESAIAGVLPDALVTGYYNVSAVDAEQSVVGSVVCPLLSDFPLLQTILPVDFCREYGGFSVDLAEAGGMGFLAWAGFNHFTDPSTQALSDLIRGYVENGFRVILLPHSQGNYFVDIAIDKLPASDYQSAIGVIMTGSPMRASFMPGGIVRRVDNCEDPVPYWLVDVLMLGCVEPGRTYQGYLEPHYFLGGYMGANPWLQIRDALHEMNIRLRPRGWTGPEDPVMDLIADGHHLAFDANQVTARFDAETRRLTLGGTDFDFESGQWSFLLGLTISYAGVGEYRLETGSQTSNYATLASLERGAFDSRVPGSTGVIHITSESPTGLAGSFEFRAFDLVFSTDFIEVTCGRFFVTSVETTCSWSEIPDPDDWRRCLEDPGR